MDYSQYFVTYIDLIDKKNDLKYKTCANPLILMAFGFDDIVQSQYFLYIRSSFIHKKSIVAKI